MQRKTILIGAGVIVAAAGWYLFRPERLFVDRVVNESFAVESEETMPIAAGMFHGVAHEGMGTATIHRRADGTRVLRLTDFRTSNGPDLQLYLVAATDATDDKTVTDAGFITLGALKGNEGDQNYEIPADVDLATYRAVTVWCRRFGVNFTTAPLGEPMEGTVAMAEPMPASASARAVASGSFHSNAHETVGTATIHELDGGRRVLRLTDFRTSNGPDVQVYLVAATDVTDDATVKAAGFVNVGALKGNVGDQNYEIPADVDLAKYRSVTIWCRRFSVNFGTAPLAPTPS